MLKDLSKTKTLSANKSTRDVSDYAEVNLKLSEQSPMKGGSAGGKPS